MDANREAALRRLQTALNYEFNQPDLLELALTHSSAAARDNERLEFLGDSVLGFVISERLFSQFPQENEGALTRLRARLVRGKTLGEVARELQLGDSLVLGMGERKTGGQRRASILADALEAILGAILLDGGLAAVRRSILTIFATRLITLPPAESLKDAKTRLQEYLQARGMELPEYRLLRQAGPDHARVFTIQCQIEGSSQVHRLARHRTASATRAQSISATASASSRRQAEQQAAAQVLELLSAADPAPSKDSSV